MSAFILKIIAVFSMFIDHSALLLSHTGIIENEAVHCVLRAIGRISFPIYCFMLVNGFAKTHDRKKYFMRLCIFALISQIPYSLTIVSSELSLSVKTHIYFSYKTGLALLVPLAVYYKTVLNKRFDLSLAILAAALFLSCLSVEAGGYAIISRRLNIFYTLAFSLGMMAGIEKLLSDHDVSLTDKFLIFLAGGTAFLFVQLRADYGYMGALLVLLLYYARKNRLYQCVFIALWAITKYGLAYDGLLYTFGTIISAVLIYYYNGNRGKNARHFFYSFYPLHLILLFIVSEVSSL